MAQLTGGVTVTDLCCREIQVSGFNLPRHGGTV
jgi:hypothetical protein